MIIALGKTALVRRVCECFCDPSKVSDITAGTFENIFGLTPRMGMHMCFMPDAKHNADHLNEEMFHGLIEGTRSTAAKKNDNPLNNKKASFSLASMSNMSMVPHAFRDDGSGSMIKRIAPYAFSVPKKIDNNLVGRVIQQELPAVFNCILQEYVLRLELMGHSRVMSDCQIDYFKRQHDLMHVENNHLRLNRQPRRDDQVEQCKEFILRFLM